MLEHLFDDLGEIKISSNTNKLQARHVQLHAKPFRSLNVPK